jgi:tRNA pseudouridine55 synthase
MAEGLMLLLVGDENKKRKQYEELPKTYEFSLVLGIATDTYDLMGKITATSFDFSYDLTHDMVKTLQSFIGEITLPYPPYSSRTFNGKPLYWYARNNLLETIEIPTRRVNITKLSLLSSTLFPTHSLLDHIFRIIPEVQGDFRQDEILQIWRNASPRFPTHLPQYSFTMTCTSGTYVRQIVHEIGEKLRVPTVTSSLKRVRIGDYQLKDALQSSE